MKRAIPWVVVIAVLSLIHPFVAVAQSHPPLEAAAFATLLNHLDSDIDRSIDSIPTLLTELEERAARTPSEVEQALLYSTIATLYSDYYSLHRYKYDQRPTLVGDTVRDIRLWSAQQLQQHIYHYALRSLAHKEQLLQTTIPPNSPLFAQSAEYQLPWSNLYGALCSRAIQLLKGASRSEKVEESILHLYPQLLASEHNPTLVAMVKVEQLRYLASIDRSSTPLLEQLKRLWQGVSDAPQGVVYLNAIASEVATSSNYAELKWVVDRCQRSIDRFPEQPNTPQTQQLLAQITAPELHLTFDQSPYPHKPLTLPFQYKNIEQLTTTIYRDGGDLPHALTPEVVERLTPLTTSTQPCSDTLTLVRDSATLTLLPLPVGRYIVAFTTHDSQEQLLATRFVVTRFCTVIAQRKVLITDAYSGKPLRHIAVELYPTSGYNHYLPATQRVVTNRHGVAELPRTNQLGVRPIAGSDSVATITRLPYYSSATDRAREVVRLFTDRALYRPSDTLACAGVLYRQSTTHNEVLPQREVTLQLRDSRYQLLATQTVVSNEMGSFSTTFTLPTTGVTGQFSLVAVGSDERSSATTPFEVATYKRPTFAVTYAPFDTLQTVDQPLTIKGSAVGYSGVPMAGAKVHYTIRRSEGWWRYRLSTSYQQVVDNYTKTDENGAFSFEFIPTNPSHVRSVIYLITSEVTSLSGEQISATTHLVVGSKPIVINTPLPKVINKEAVDKLPIEVTNLLNQPLSLPCSYQLIAASGEVCDRGEFTTPQQPSIEAWRRVESGEYTLQVTATDAVGDTVMLHHPLLLYSLRDSRPPIHTPLWMPTKQLTCPKGERATLVLGTSLRNAYLSYFLYDGDRLIEQGYKRLSNRNDNFTFPYKRAYGNQLQLVVVLVNEGRVEVARAQIDAPKVDSRLTIQSESFRDHLHAGAKEHWRFRVTDGSGKGVEARFMATMFDAALDALQPHSWYFNPQLLETNRYISVRTTQQVERERIYYAPHDWDTPIPLRPQQLRTPQIPYLNYALRGGNRLMAAAKSSQWEESERVEMVGALAKSEDVVEEVQRELPPFAYRTDFTPTALFAPQLMTDSQGEVWVAFELPQANTTWKFMALAYTAQLAHGSYTRTTIAAHPLMVTPHLPRALHQGDRATLPLLLSNQSDTLQQGEVVVELFHPESHKVLSRSAQPFTLATGCTLPLTFALDAPLDLNLLGVRIKATGTTASDGEQHLLPLLPSRRLVTETLSLNMGVGEQEATFTMKQLQHPSSYTLTHDRLTLEFASQPIWYVVQALPSLLTGHTSQSTLQRSAALYAEGVVGGIIRDNPLLVEAITHWQEDAQQGDTTLLSQLDRHLYLKQILLENSPWLLQATSPQEELQQLSQLLDSARNAQQLSANLTYLSNCQQRDGGWAWFDGMASHPTVTLEVLTQLTRLAQQGWLPQEEALYRMQHQAIAYLDRHFAAQPSLSVPYLYLRSCYRDIPLGDLLAQHRVWMAQLKAEAKGLSLYHQALAVVALYNYGEVVASKALLDRLLSISTYTPREGRYWQNSRYQHASIRGEVNTQCALIAAVACVEATHPAIEEMKQWLLLQKQRCGWGSTFANVEAISALLTTGGNWIVQDNSHTTIEWGSKLITSDVDHRSIGYQQLVKVGDEVTPADATVTLSRSATTPAWGALYWQYYDNLMAIEPSQSEEIRLSKQLYLVQGEQLLPIDSIPLKVGDRVHVRLTLEVKNLLAFVQLRDERAACLEPTETLSRYVVGEGLHYYLEQRDEATNLYFELLPKGSYHIGYTTYVDREGSYHNGIATVQSLFAPQVTAHTGGSQLTIPPTEK